MTDAITRLDYRLEPRDLTGVLAAQRRCSCRSQCLGWAGSLAILFPIALILGHGSARFGGARAVVLATGVAASVLLLAALIREAIAHRRCRDHARLLGLPRDVSLRITPGGMVLEPDPDGTGRAYAWSEIAEVAHVGHATLVRLRVPDFALMIPDRAFTVAADREALVRRIGEAASESGHSVPIHA